MVDKLRDIEWYIRNVIAIHLLDFVERDLQQAPQCLHGDFLFALADHVVQSRQLRLLLLRNLDSGFSEQRLEVNECQVLLDCK